MRAKRIFVGSIVLTGVVVLTALFWSISGNATAAGNRDLVASTSYRTVVVVRSGNPLSRSLMTVTAKYVRGTMPSRPGWGTVLTDVACAPDRREVSHCLNDIRMNSGARFTVRHNHRMHDVPCLFPGEKVRVLPR